jgi:hypothetical protein
MVSSRITSAAQADLSHTYAVRLPRSRRGVVGVCGGYVEAGWAVYLWIRPSGDAKRVRQW